MSDNNKYGILYDLKTNFKTLVDANRGVFTYGLTEAGYEHSQFEDPTYLGFTIEIDPKSALFNEVEPFMKRNSSHLDIAARENLYNDFCQKIQMIFNSQDSANQDTKTLYVKQHYINSISGLQNLTKKFVSFKEDKLTIELHEDLSLFSSYMAYVYNNLVYSYETGRLLIPENLLYFNLYIKFSEIRNLTSLKALGAVPGFDSDIQLAKALKKNTTAVTYKLTDCMFNFFEAVPFGDQLIQSGIGNAPPAHSVVTFDLFFKRSSVLLNTPLLQNSYSIDNRDVGLGLKPVEKLGVETPNNTDKVNGLQGETIDGNKDIVNEDIKKNQTPEEKEKRKKETYNEQTNFDIFTNSHKKGISSLNTIDLESESSDNLSSMQSFQEALEIIQNYNEGSLLTKLTDAIDKKIVKDADGNDIEVDMTKEDIMALGDTARVIKSNNNNKKKKKKNKNGQTVDTNNWEDDANESKKTWIQKTEDGWREIRTANNMITDYYSIGKNKSDNFFTDKLGNNLGGKVNQVTNAAGNMLMQTLKKYEDMLNQKKNEMLNTFINTLKGNAKVLIDYNVYTDQKDPMLQPLSDFYVNVGNNVADQVLDMIKGGSNINIFGTGSTGGGL